MDGLTILCYPMGLRNIGLITQKTLFQYAFAQFLRYSVETSQVRQWLTATGCERVGDSTLPHGAQK